eukprot:3190024-Pyramimonas_sp.AAC.1
METRVGSYGNPCWQLWKPVFTMETRVQLWKPVSPLNYTPVSPACLPSKWCCRPLFCCLASSFPPLPLAAAALPSRPPCGVSRGAGIEA